MFKVSTSCLFLTGVRWQQDVMGASGGSDRTVMDPQGVRGVLQGTGRGQETVIGVNGVLGDTEMRLTVDHRHCEVLSDGG